VEKTSDTVAAGIASRSMRTVSNQSYVLNAASFTSQATQMTDLEVLARNIDELKELLRGAWKDLANPALTPFERREARNQIDQHGAELRRHLELIEAERNRVLEQSSAGRARQSRERQNRWHQS
jgi:hypothetical protein